MNFQFSKALTLFANGVMAVVKFPPLVLLTARVTETHIKAVVSKNKVIRSN